MPGLAQSAVDPHGPLRGRSIQGKFLLDCLIDHKHSRAVGSGAAAPRGLPPPPPPPQSDAPKTNLPPAACSPEPIVLLVPYLWDAFGRRHAYTEALIYMVGFILPL
eukprot:SAG11_NODE_5240_length_1619_cov_10.888816_2_plen_105_part_01